ncbi:MAG: hypothetical protein AB7L92_07740 [Alphaproteobacteria bacterium]
MFARRLLASFFVCAVCILPTAGCEDASPVELPPLSFKQFLPIHMAVSRIDVIEEYKSPMALPNVEHLVPYSPTEAMRIWVDHRLVAVGIDNTLQVIIKNAPVTVHQMPIERDWPSFFTGQPDKRYDAELEVEMRIYQSGSALSLAKVNTRAKRSVVINDSVTVLERDRALRKMITELMTMMNATLEEHMFEHMANHISFSQNP